MPQLWSHSSTKYAVFRACGWDILLPATKNLQNCGNCMRKANFDSSWGRGNTKSTTISHLRKWQKMVYWLSRLLKPPLLPPRRLMPGSDLVWLSLTTKMMMQSPSSKGCIHTWIQYDTGQTAPLHNHWIQVLRELEKAQPFQRKLAKSPQPHVHSNQRAEDRMGYDMINQLYSTMPWSFAQGTPILI